ncbi:winged helix DNA-binding protein [Limnohabitans sp. Rim8]|jgi:predicted MarR family transcription regulator|uniref:winged helix DNA-binding protein n=1 Tax=Limnohabitans sp. Rim8 TaxID=1100718 RepID=UPI00260BCD25|nr:winged helix DNA-binding protein [Limnohabitans sp. Rim8]
MPRKISNTSDTSVAVRASAPYSAKVSAPSALRKAATPIVSSAHLVSSESAELSEFEFGLIVAGNAFHRWIVHCMTAAGLKDLTPLDVLVLHHVTHRARDKRLADICFIMNVEDTHLINYALKKLQGLGVVASHKSGKDVTYAATESGRNAVQRYRDIRESCLIDALQADNALNKDIGDLARLLRVLSGMYDQAARAAASL